MRTSMVCMIAMTGAALAQTPAPQAPGPKLEFEVASVKPSPPPTPGTVTMMGLRGGPGSTDPERVNGKIDLRNGLLQAFGVSYDRLTAPDWLRDERYDIMAVVPAGATKEQFNIMLQNLLIDRFKIQLHHVQKDFPVYDVTVAKGGLKMKPSTAVPRPPPTPAGPASADPVAAQAQAQQALVQLRANAAGGRGNERDKDGFPALPEGNQAFQRGIGENGKMMINARGQSMEAIVRTLQQGLGSGARVIDKTGLAGLYDFKFQYATPNAPAPAAQAAAGLDAQEPAPDALTAALTQLGLKLEKSTASFDVLVIDHIEKTPVDN